MSVHLCDRCGEVTVNAELCRCAAAAAKLSQAGRRAESAGQALTAVPGVEDRPARPGAARLDPVAVARSRAA